jgi:hypothetical protein
MNDIEDRIAPIITAIQGISISGQWFLTYQRGELKGGKFSEFGLKRGYITIKKRFSPLFSGRITPDISVDKEGDGKGDIEMRLKYCYLQYNIKGIGFLTSPYFEFGLVHRPWLDFEEHINMYRVQGKMFLERIGVFNSADYGLTFISLFGGTMDEEYRKNISNSYPGTFGSLAIGVYNGGGYHAIEENRNKTVEGRLTLRPLPLQLPGLQLSFQGAYGKGNSIAAPDWFLRAGILSWQHPGFVLTGLAFAGSGNSSGTLISDDGEPVDQKGYSFFTEIHLWPKIISLFGRYDQVDREYAAGDIRQRGYIAGIAYHFLSKCKMLLDYDRVEYPETDRADYFVEFAIEVHY